MNYESLAIFEERADHVISSAQRDDMVWVLLSYLQTASSQNEYSEKATELLIRLYWHLRCPINCRYLQAKMACAVIRSATTTEDDRSYGLILKSRLAATTRLFLAPRLGSLWKERDALIQEIRTNEADLTRWLHLVRQYTELEELLMAVWTLFLIKLNAPAVGVGELLDEQVNCIEAYAGSGGLWAFVSETTCTERVRRILDSDDTREHLASSISRMLCESMGVRIGECELLQPWRGR